MACIAERRELEQDIGQGWCGVEGVGLGADAAQTMQAAVQHRLLL